MAASSTPSLLNPLPSRLTPASSPDAAIGARSDTANLRAGAPPPVPPPPLAMARPRALPLLLLACTLVCIIPVSLGLTVPLVASQQCYSSFAQLTNSQTIADVCAGLRAMGQACLVEMQQEAAAEEAAGIAGTISS